MTKSRPSASPISCSASRSVPPASDRAISALSHPTRNGFRVVGAGVDIAQPLSAVVAPSAVARWMNFRRPSRATERDAITGSALSRGSRNSWDVDHLRRSAQHAVGKRQTDLPRHRAVQGDVEDAVFLDREVAWIRSFEDLVDLSGDAPPTRL